jgi:hypothetical protein
MKPLSILAVSAALSMSAFGAFAATQVELKNMAARVVVIAEDRADVALTVSYGTAKLPVIMVHTSGDKYIADGKLKRRSMACQHDGAVRISGVGTVAQADLPVVHIRVPKNASVSAGGATFGTINETQNLDLAIGGCGNWTVANVAGRAELAVGGSGTINAGSAKSFEVAIGGSGDVHGQNAQGLEASIGGHGNVVFEKVDGPVEASIGGSGNVEIKSGMTPKLEVAIGGSGNVRHGGEVKDVEVSIAGSGDVYIKKVTGAVEKSVFGSGKIHIGE